MAQADRYTELEARVAALESAISGHCLEAIVGQSGEVVPVPPWLEGTSGPQRYPKCWRDAPVRHAVIDKHRSVEIDQAVAEIAGEFGADRAPSRSALQRIWKRLDSCQRTTVGAWCK